MSQTKYGSDYVRGSLCQPVLSATADDDSDAKAARGEPAKDFVGETTDGAPSELRRIAVRESELAGLLSDYLDARPEQRGDVAKRLMARSSGAAVAQQARELFAWVDVITSVRALVSSENDTLT